MTFNNESEAKRKTIMEVEKAGNEHDIYSDPDGTDLFSNLRQRKCDANKKFFRIWWQIYNDD